MPTLSQQVVLVTGAGRGIGKAVAEAFLAAGSRVVLAARSAGQIEAIAAAATAQGHHALAVPCDVTDAASVDALFAAIAARFGRLDTLFNNAGISAKAAPIDEIDVAQWRAVVDTNLTGMFLCTQGAFRLMKSQTPRGGRIINNGSISAYVPRPRGAPYTATKHAVSGLTKTTSLDGRAHDIACGQIDIGNAATEMTAPMMAGILQASGAVAPEPVMDVAHVASAVLYMAGLPLDANVQNMTLMATTMPFIGRG